MSSLFVRKARFAQRFATQAGLKLGGVMSEIIHPAKSIPSSSKPGLLFRLPEELLIAILLYLDEPSISACNQTCHGLRHAIANSMLLQYKLALFYSGMLDGPRIDPDHHTQLYRFLAHDAAWRQLRWVEVHSLTHLTGPFHPAAISGRTIAFIPFGPGPVSGFRLFIQQFPSAFRGTEIKQWELQFQVMSVHDTLLDASQNLLILLECDPLTGYTTAYLVYSMLTGEPHPLAAHRGRIAVPDGLKIVLEGSGICEDYLGAVAFNVWDGFTYLVLWNWKTGEAKVNSRLPTPSRGLKPAFNFLDRHHILTGFLWEDESQPRDLLVCALDQQCLSDDGLINAVPTFLFTVPGKLPQRDYWEMTTHRNAIPIRPKNCSLEGYFDNNPDDQLIVIEIASRWYASEKACVAMTLFIPTRAMLSRITTYAPASPTSPTSHTSSSLSSSSYTTMPVARFVWDRWGKDHVLLEKRRDRERRLPMLSRVCGLRVVSRRPVVLKDDSVVVRVMDFHPHRAMRSVGTSNPSGRLGSRGAAPLHAVIDVPLPEEARGVDPILFSTVICQDALIIFERLSVDSGGLRNIHLCSF